MNEPQTPDPEAEVTRRGAVRLIAAMVDQVEVEHVEDGKQPGWVRYRVDLDGQQIGWLDEHTVGGHISGAGRVRWLVCLPNWRSLPGESFRREHESQYDALWALVAHASGLGQVAPQVTP